MLRLASASAFIRKIHTAVAEGEEEADIDLMAVRREREQLKAELARLELQRDAYLKELGYE